MSQSRNIARRGQALSSQAWFDAPAGSIPYKMPDGSFAMATLDEDGNLVYPGGSRNPQVGVDHYTMKLDQLYREEGFTGDDPDRYFSDGGDAGDDYKKYTRKLRDRQGQLEADQAKTSRETNLESYGRMFKDINEPLRIQTTDEVAVGQQTEMNSFDNYAARANLQTSGFAATGKAAIEATRQNRTLWINQTLKQKEKEMGISAAFAGQAAAVGIQGGIPIINPQNFSRSAPYLSGLGDAAGQFRNALALRDPSDKNDPDTNAFYDSGSFPRREGQPQFVY